MYRKIKYLNQQCIIKTLFIVLLFSCFIGFAQETKTVKFTVPSSITLEGTAINVTGFGLNNGKIQGLIYSGGTPNYTTTWTKDSADYTPTNLNQLYAGVYIVTVKDANGCSASKTFTIVEPKKLECTISGTTIACYGNATGTASVSITEGGTVGTGYTYEWFKNDVSINIKVNSITGQTAGVYKVQVKDNASPKNQAWSNELIIQPKSPITTNFTKTNVSCNGGNDGTITLNITGGTAPYTIKWNDDVTTQNRTGLGAGSYSYTITDKNDCTYNSTENIVITPPPALSFSSITQTQPTPGLSDGTITANTTGGTPPYAYTFKNGATVLQHGSSNKMSGLANGTYQVMVTDANVCKLISNDIVLAELSVTIQGTSTIKCFGGTNSLTATASGGSPSTAGYTYKWFKNNVELNQTTSVLSNCTIGTYKVVVSDATTTKEDSYTLTQNPEITFTPTAITHVSCAGGTNGSITISVNGGVTASNLYAYSLNKTGTLTPNGKSVLITNLAATNYELTVTDDNNCPKIYSFSITQPNAITIPEPTITNVAIYGQTTGAISVGEITGGSAPYTYNWVNLNDTNFPKTDKNINNLKSGVYTLTITDNLSCTATKVVTITQNDKLLVDLKQTETIDCFGYSTGAIAANITGGVAPFKYEWYDTANNLVFSTATTNTISGLPIGTYHVKVIDSVEATETSNNLPITQPSLLTATKTSQTNVRCYGANTGAISINIQGGTPNYFVNWTKNGIFFSTSTNLTGLASGTYSVSITDAMGCNTKMENIIITQPKAPLSLTSYNLTHLTGFETQNGSITVNIEGGTTPYSYNWSKTGDPTFTANNSSKTITGLKIGTYELVVLDANDCVLDTQTYTIIQPDKLVITAIDQTPFTQNKCYGEATVELTATVTGGFGSYNYNWVNTATGTTVSTNANATPLGEATYQLTVTDSNGNKVSQLITVTAPSQLVVTPTASAVLCKGTATGSISLAIAGGTPNLSGTPYAIVWDYNNDTNANKTIVTGLPIGTYKATISDANNCERVVFVAILEPTNQLTIEGNITNASGFNLSNGSIRATVSGGTAGYTYQWFQNGVQLTSATTAELSNQLAGTYTVTISDVNGCQVSKTFDIRQPQQLQLKLEVSDAVCNGGTGQILATALGGAPVDETAANRIYTYELYDNASKLIETIVANTALFSNKTAQNYTIKVIDIISNAVQVNTSVIQPSPIVINLINTINAQCYDSQDGSITISVSGGTPELTTGYTYKWSKSGGKSFSNSQKNITDLTAGFYSVTVTDNNNCTATYNNIEIKQPKDYQFDTDKNTYVEPTTINPNGGSLTTFITGGLAPYTYTCSTAADNVEVSRMENTNDQSITFSNLGSTVYKITAKDATGCTLYTEFSFIDSPIEVVLAVSSPILCYDDFGKISATISGGFGSKHIKWYDASDHLLSFTSTEITVKAGDYYIVVIDDKKTEKTSNKVTITQPNLVVGTATPTPANCFGDNSGQITLTATGGNGNYKYKYALNGSGFSAIVNFSSTGATSINNLKAGTYTINIEDTNTCTSILVTATVTQPTAPLTVSFPTISHATGFGLANGYITTLVSGGNGDYIYNWYKTDGTALNQSTAIPTNLALGEYYVIITDSKNCQIQSSSVTITQPKLLEATISQTRQNLCFGNKNANLQLSVSGGVAPYTYNWFSVENTSTSIGDSDTKTTLGSGTYFAIVTDANNNSIQTNNYNIVDPTPIANYLTADYVRCGDGADWTIMANPSGGTPGYSYLWNNNTTLSYLENVVSGVYSVTVKDKNGCTTTTNITIKAPNHLDVSVKLVNPTCFKGNDATIEVSTINGTAPFTYLWNTAATTSKIQNVPAGDYQVTITDSRGCTIVKNYKLIDPEEYKINLGADMTLCIDQSVTINATVADNKAIYSWTSTNGFKSSNPIVTLSLPDTYTLTVTNSLGCIATDDLKINFQQSVIDATFLTSSQVFVNEPFYSIDISNPKADNIEWVLPKEGKLISNSNGYLEMSFDKAGEYEITLVTKLGNCTATQIKKLVVIEGEINTAGTDTTNLNGALVIYPNPSSGKFSVNWSADFISKTSVKIYKLVDNTIIAAQQADTKNTYQFEFDLQGFPSGVYFVIFESNKGNILRKLIIQ